MESVDAVIVGGGLAGLACAQLLDGRCSVLLLEASDRLGGRVATDQVDGFRIDRGFQLLNPAYPALPRVVDLAALKVRPLPAGVQLARSTTTTELYDPRRSPLSVLRTLHGLPGATRTQLSLARYLAKVALPPHPRPIRDTTTAATLAANGIDGALVDQLLQPFLAGVTLDPSLETSARFTELVLRSMLRGTPGVPAGGMGALPSAMARRLQHVEVRTETPVTGVRAGLVSTPHGEVAAHHVVLAVDAPAASRLLPGLPVPSTRSVTTWWYATAHAVPAAPLWLDLSPSPITNVASMSGAAPSYAPPGRGLVASSTPGLHPSSEIESAVRSRVAELLGLRVREVDLVATSVVEHALPAMVAPLEVRPPLAEGGVLLAGDYRATASIQGALASGRRAGWAINRRLSGSA